jgi:hypothetical protein
MRITKSETTVTLQIALASGLPPVGPMVNGKLMPLILRIRYSNMVGEALSGMRYLGASVESSLNPGYSAIKTCPIGASNTRESFLICTG